MPRIFANMRSLQREWLFSAIASQIIKALSAEFQCIRSGQARRKSRPRIRRWEARPRQSPHAAFLEKGYGVQAGSTARRSTPKGKGARPRRGQRREVARCGKTNTDTEEDAGKREG